MRGDRMTDLTDEQILARLADFEKELRAEARRLVEEHLALAKEDDRATKEEERVKAFASALDVLELRLSRLEGGKPLTRRKGPETSLYDQGCR